MKRYIYILLLPFLLLACHDSDKNPWKNKKPTPPKVEGIVELDGELDDLRDGITVLDDSSLAFVLYAPGKQSVELVGDFTEWEAEGKYKLNKTDDRFWIRLTGFEADKEYGCQYVVDGTIRIADPYAQIVLDPNDKYIDASVYPNLMPYPKGAKDEIAMVVSTSTSKYPWQVNNFKVDNPDEMVIYELLIRDFTEERTIAAAEQKIPYLKELGVDVVQLLPFNEFEGNDSWGYNPSYLFATDKAYGTPEAYKRFIDACHKEGIAVFMDMVLNHVFSQSPLVKLYSVDGKLTAGNPYFNLESPNTEYSWGYDFNHESKATEALVDSVCAYWMDEYNIDGFRFDFTKGFTNTVGDGWEYDADRIRILKRMADEVWKRNSDAVIIFEHLTDNKEEVELANYGIYLWGNMNYAYNQATMGYDKNDLNWTSYQLRGWTEPRLVSYMESHDEERLMYKNLAHGNKVEGYDVTDLATALKRNEAAAVLYFSFPGPKMIWQFGERGYDIELNGPDNKDRLKPKPPHWEYMDVPERKALYNLYSEMLSLRKKYSAFATQDYEPQAGEGGFKQILLRDNKASICAVANLGMVTKEGVLTLDKSGTWVDHFSDTKLEVTGESATITLQPGEYRLYIQQK